MISDHLRRLDLNLLVALDALLENRSVTRAGDELGLTQSALSRSLGRLRLIFDDELLVRAGRTMTLTPTAQSLREPLRHILDEIRTLVRPRSFDPAQAGGSFGINAPDATIFLALPKVFQAIAQKAPSLDIHVTNRSEDRLHALARGDYDLLIDAVPDVEEPFHRLCLATGRFICLVRVDHPVVRAGLTAREYTSMAHVTIDVASNRILEETLHEHGIRRRSALTIPNFIIAAEAVSETDWILTAPEGLAERLQQAFPLTMLRFPLQSPELTLDIVWHKRSDTDPAHLWLRNEIVANVPYRKE